MEQDITQYIPQRSPFVMIDKIVQADASVSKTEFTIREGHMFVQDGFFTEPGIVENIAQTAGAGTGYRKQQEGKPVPLGYIGALKNLNIMDLPKIGDTIITEISFINKIMNVHIVQGRVYNHGNEIANCELKIFEEPS
jgi:3-hydroxyacyl-[acyl-carrier-protein] dehydratase